MHREQDLLVMLAHTADSHFEVLKRLQDGLKANGIRFNAHDTKHIVYEDRIALSVPSQGIRANDCIHK